MNWKKSPQELIDLFASVMPGPLAVGRKMFGYPAAFVNGNMFMGLFQEEMLLRLGESERADLLKIPGAKNFAPMPGRPMREYISVPPELIKNKAKLAAWIAKSLAYGQSLRPKDKSVKKTKPAARSARPAPSRKKK
jgi:TfoX/Sxy family transcriptional regulator of competence genes